MATPHDVLSGEARLIRTALASVLALVLGVASVMPSEGLPFPSCVFRGMTGMSCLTCGLTRSLQAVTQGHLLTAFQFHLLGPFLVAGMLAAIVVCIAEASTGRRLRLLRPTNVQKPILLGFVAVWIMYGVVRAIAELV